LKIKMTVREGVVTLTGSANDAEGKQAAETVVRRVPGVREVHNQLVVAEPGVPAPGASVIPEVPATPPAR
jgi:BON domain